MFLWAFQNHIQEYFKLFSKEFIDIIYKFRIVWRLQLEHTIDVENRMEVIG